MSAGMQVGPAAQLILGHALAKGPEKSLSEEELSCAEGDGHAEAIKKDARPGSAHTGPPSPELHAADDCQICLAPLLCQDWRSPLGDADPAANTVNLVCGHAFHLACLASHVQAKCQEAEASAQAELRGRDTDMELERETRTNALGVTRNLAEMHAHGQIRQCPRCKYGPVLNTNCTDLQRHDSDRGYGQGRTTNSCPNCHFFSARWSDWSIWNAADPTSAVRCPLCRAPCIIDAAEVLSLQDRFAEADRQFKGISTRLSESLHRSRRSRNRCEDLIALLLHLQDELQDPVNHAQPNLNNFEELVAVGESPERFQRLLQGPLRQLLWRRLQMEEEHMQGLCRASEARGPTVGQAGNCSGSSSSAEQDGRDDRQRSPRGVGHRRKALNEEILTLAARPAAYCGTFSSSQDEARSLNHRLQELAEHRRQLALLLCTAGDLVDPSVARILGRPWQPEGSGGGPIAPVLRRDAMEHRIHLRRRMMAATRREPDHGRGPGERQPWSFVIRLLKELLDGETPPSSAPVGVSGGGVLFPAYLRTRPSLERS